MRRIHVSALVFALLVVGVTIYYMADVPASASAHDARRGFNFPLAITTRGLAINTVDDLPFFKYFAPSLAATLEPARYRYSVYLGIDSGDAYLDNAVHQEAIRAKWRTLMGAATGVALEFFVFNNTASRNTWASNYLVNIAYARGWDYFYRVNDDSELLSPGWSSKFEAAFQSMRPVPFLGTVAPKDISYDGQTLAHNCVHRMHIETFGFMFPYSLPNQWSDNWAGDVYRGGDPATRMAIQLMDCLIHHHGIPPRYDNRFGGQPVFQRQLEIDKELLSTRIAALIIL